ncbi:hypothetical protein JCM19992_12880 [Thermostilla marina]
MKKSALGRWGSDSRSPRRGRKHRRLTIDALEERTMLSVSPMQLDDTLVNQSLISFSTTGPKGSSLADFDGGTIEAQSIAVDNDGDFVIAWSRLDPVLDPNTGLPMVDPQTGEPLTESNIYARYFTDEVQRVTLPSGVVADNVAGAYGTFTLVYGGYQLKQKLTFSATYEPYTTTQQPIAGQVVLQADGNGDGVIDPSEKTTFVYDETQDPATIAEALQSGLQGIGGALQDAKVTAISSKEFIIEYGDAELGIDQPKLEVGSATWTSGFLPAATLTVESEPIVIADIPVSPDNPAATANAIEQAFALRAKNYPIGPVSFPPPSRVPGVEGPYRAPQTLRTAVPGVSVTAVSATQFDIRFTGDSAKEDHPTLIVSDVRDDLGNSLLPSIELNVQTLKQSSPEFRVNPEEPDNPLTPGPDQLDQTNPAVAMDADGDFVIVWESEVTNFQDFGSVTDIFGRRYMPVGTTVLGPDDIPGVRPVAVPDTEGSFRVDEYTFRVNDNTTNPQFDPAVAMDDAGNFVVAWASGGQDFSFFNSVNAQIFNRHGERVGVEFQVNNEATAALLDPAVGMSHDGNFVITWSQTNDPDYLLWRNGGFPQQVFTSTINAVAYDPSGTVLLPQFSVGSGWRSMVSFDSANHFVVAWETVGTSDNTQQNSIDTHAIMYELVDATGTPTGTVLRDEFRLNSAAFDPGDATLWPYSQVSANAGLDADGDIIGVYEGYGPDTSDFLSIPGAWLSSQINASTNADLLPYFDPATENIDSFLGFGFGFGYGVDVDSVIEQYLVRAVNRGANSEQLGRLRAILDSVAGLMRGEANGILGSRFDADPQFSTLVLESDSVLNAQRDGHNTRYYIVMDAGLNWESFTLRLFNDNLVGFEDLTVNNIQQNNTFSPTLAAQRIDEVLEGSDLTGVNWPETAYDGPVHVRLVSGLEIVDRQGTPWEIRDGFGNPVDPFGSYVFEVTFQGEVHDTGLTMFPIGTARAGGADVAPPDVVLFEAGTEGTPQTEPSLGVMPDGSFVVAWTQWEQSTDGTYTNKSIYYREFKESVDTAGPIVTDLVAPDGTKIDDGDVVVTDDGLQYLVVTFDEEMLAYDQATLGWALQERDNALANGLPVPAAVKHVLDSVTNPENYRLARNGVLMGGSIVHVDFGMNMASQLADTLGLDPTPTNKWEAVLTIDADAGQPGLQPLPADIYSLEVVAPIGAGQGQLEQSGVRDKVGNPLGRTGFAPNGASFVRNFRVLIGLPGPEVPGEPGEGAEDSVVNTTLLGDQTDVAVAMNNNGDYVVVWVSPDQGADAGTGQTNIIAQRYNREGEPQGPEFIVNTYETGDQVQPDVAMDDTGNFIVVWAGEGEDDLDGGIFARRFDRFGTPQGDQFRVNQYRLNLQDSPQVAADSVGNFVITWTSFGQDGDSDGVYARQYNRYGQPIADEFRINDTTANRQQNSDVAMDDAGNFVAVWMSYGQDSNEYGIVGKVYNADGTARTGEFGINQYVNDEQIDPQVAMDADGDFVVTWASFLQDGSGYGVYARMFSPAGTPKGNEFQVNETTLHWQYQPVVAMDKAGDFTIAWNTSGQDNDLAVDDGIYARMFQADGSDFVLPPKGHQGEFRVNAFTAGNQVTPAIAMDAVGNYVVAWVGPTTETDPLIAPLNGTDIFTRLLDPPGLAPREVQTIAHLTGTTGDDVFEFVADANSSNWIVKVNGQTQAVADGMTTVRFDGLSGYDQVKITGTTGADSARLWGNGVALNFGTDFVVDATNVEAVDLNGNGGADTLEIWDSVGTDMVALTPTTARLYSDSFSHIARGFTDVVAHAGEGVDIVSLYDTAGDDVVTGSPEAMELVGSGVRLRAEGFEFAHAYATAGGNDSAQFVDGLGGDTVTATPSYTILDGADYYLRAKGFENVVVDTSTGGIDVGRLVGSNGNDQLTITAKLAELSGAGYALAVRDLDTISVDAAGGSADKATIIGTAGNEVMLITPTLANVTGTTYAQSLRGFEYVDAHSGGGEDVVHLYDSPGNDVFTAKPDYIVLAGNGFRLTAEGFRWAHGYATRGGADVAHLYDSPGNDTFQSYANMGKMYGNGFYLRAKAFDYVHAYSEAGGVDRAYLWGTAGNETIYANDQYVRMDGVYGVQRAKWFEEVVVRGEGGFDTAYVTGGTVLDGVVTRASSVLPADVAELAWLVSVDRIRTINEGGTGQNRTIEAADQIFTSYWRE